MLSYCEEIFRKLQAIPPDLPTQKLSRPGVGFVMSGTIITYGEQERTQ